MEIFSSATKSQKSSADYADFRRLRKQVEASKSALFRFSENLCKSVDEKPPSGGGEADHLLFAFGVEGLGRRKS